MAALSLHCDHIEWLRTHSPLHPPFILLAIRNLELTCPPKECDWTSHSGQIDLGPLTFLYNLVAHP